VFCTYICILFDFDYGFNAYFDFYFDFIPDSDLDWNSYISNKWFINIFKVYMDSYSTIIFDKIFFKRFSFKEYFLLNFFYSKVMNSLKKEYFFFRIF